MSHCQKILDALRDGQWHTTAQLYRECGPMILHSRISDLRHKGFQIEGRHVPGQTGARGYKYRLQEATQVRRPVDPPPDSRRVPAAEQLALHVAPEHYDF